MEIEKQRIEGREVNYVSVSLGVESGCDPSAGEYSLHITNLIGGLDIASFGGVDDITLIKECIENELDTFKLPKEGQAFIVLKESGEWEGYSWHKYYEIERVTYIEY